MLLLLVCRVVSTWGEKTEGCKGRGGQGRVMRMGMGNGMKEGGRAVEVLTACRAGRFLAYIIHRDRDMCG